MPHKLWAALLSLSALSAPVPEFEPNFGQAGSQYRFLARAGNARIFLDDRGMRFSGPSEGAEVRLEWLGAAEQSRWSNLEPTGNTYRYCNQADPALCDRAIPTYRRVLRTGLYPGIDWVLYSRGSDLEYDLVVHPGARPEDIRLKVEGAAARLDDHGRLHAGTLIHWRPEAYQWIGGERRNVPAHLTQLPSGEFGFTLGDYRHDTEVIIDPVIESIAVSGGREDDVTAGTFSSERGGGFRYGTTRSADWTQSGADRGRDIFVQYTRWMWGTNTVFWGGDGDEEVGGADWEGGNSRLYLAGWTTSRNALIKAQYDSVARPYAGGDSDGFLLEFNGATLANATYAGGPGADRLYDIRRLGAFEYGSPGLAFAGETTDPSWPDADWRRSGAGGGSDAVAGIVKGRTWSGFLIGGGGSDRAMRIRSIDGTRWAVAGETDSPDFPSRGGPAESAARDVWAGQLRFDTEDSPVLGLFGGPGNEMFGGLGAIPELGIYIAGKTDSPDLPEAANKFGGGAWDGFVARLDPVSLEPLGSHYIGGSGEDGIAAMEAYGGRLLLGGATNSPALDNLALPGIEDAKGGFDGLFVTTDAFGAPALARRLGGGGDDRILGVEPIALGRAVVCGSSNSAEWFERLDAFTRARGGQDGFAAGISYPDVSLTIASAYIGRDLQIPVNVYATSSPGDGLLLVRSSDPAKLLVSSRYDRRGSAAVLMRDTDRATNYPPPFYLQALADSGEVDVIVEGRPGSAYPQRRIRVRLAPSALFFTNTARIRVTTRSTFNVFVKQAAVLPDGTSGAPQGTRPGIAEWSVSVTSSDPDGLPPSSHISLTRQGEYQVMLQAFRDGLYNLILSSAGAAVAPGQSLSVRAEPAVSKPFPTTEIQLAKHHVAYLTLNGSAADSFRFTSEDPSKLQLGTDSSASLATVTTGATGTLWLAALDDTGIAIVRIEGTADGAPVDRRLEVRLIPYTATLNAPRTVTPGGTFGVGVELKPRPDQSLLNQMSPNWAIFRSLRPRSSDPDAIAFVSQTFNALHFMFAAHRAGSAVIDFEDSAIPELMNAKATVEVVPVRLKFEMDQIVIPTGAAAGLFPSTNAPRDSLAQVRLRLNDGSPLMLEHLGQRGKDITVDFRNWYSAQLIAERVPPGTQSTLFVSAPGVEEFTLPIRVTETVLTPQPGELRVTAGSGEQWLYFDVSTFEGGRAGSPSPAVRMSEPVEVRPTFTPEGICELTQPLLAGGGYTTANLKYRCITPGETTLNVPQVAPLSPAQSAFSLRIVSAPDTAAERLQVPERLMVGRGLQVELGLWEARTGIASVVSSDPERVRLSLDPKAIGTERVSIPSGQPPLIYAQGMAKAGSARLTVESASGLKGEIAVHLFPATLALRPAPSVNEDLSSVTSVDLPRSVPDVSLDLRPYLVEPASGKLFYVNSLQLRAGTDPFFVRGKSSADQIMRPVPPDALMEETSTRAVLNFRLDAPGEAVVEPTQPAGFDAVPDSALRVRVVERQLKLRWPVVLVPSMQRQAWLTTDNSGDAVTVTSLEPDKLAISSGETIPGQPSIRIAQNRPMYLQASASAQPGSKVRVRLEAAGYAVSEDEVEIRSAELQSTAGAAPVSVRPLMSNQAVYLAYGPVERTTGKVSDSFNGSWNPGSAVRLRVTSSDPSVLQVLNESPNLGRSVSIGIRPIRPGTATLRVEAPEGMVNRAGEIPVTVQPFEFLAGSSERAVRHLVSKYTLRNPLSGPLTVRLSSGGPAPLRLGTSATGAGAPSASSMTVTLAGGENRVIYFEPEGEGYSASMVRSAPDFAESKETFSIDAPELRFEPAGPVTASLSGAQPALSLTLGPGSIPSLTLPLGTSLGTVQIQIRSSDERVVRTPAAPVQIRPGESRVSIPFEAVGRGDAVITFVAPPGFQAASSARSVVVTVK